MQEKMIEVLIRFMKVRIHEKLCYDLVSKGYVVTLKNNTKYYT